MTAKKIIKSSAKIALILFILLVFLLGSLFFAIRSPKFQTFVAQKVTESLSKSLGLPIQIGHLEITFFNNIDIQDFYIEDLNQDTLLYINDFNAQFSYFHMFQKKINLNHLEINTLELNIARAYEDSLFNIDQLQLSAFAGNGNSSNALSAWDLQLEEIELNNIKVNYRDYFGGLISENKIPQALINFSYFKVGDPNIEVDEIFFQEPVVSLLKQEANPTFVKQEASFEKIYLPFNLENNLLSIENGVFSYKNTLAKEIGLAKFNPNDLGLNSINTSFSNVVFAYDSLHAVINNLSISENSGMDLKQFEGQIELTNQHVSIQNLKLETGNSRLQADASLSYDSFLDFGNFIEDVRVDVNLQPSFVSQKDLVFFIAKEQFNWNSDVNLSGHVYGSVSSFKSKDLKMKTGRFTSFEGEFSMNGLPNINETFISGKVERLVTDYADLLRIYPKLPLPDDIKKLGTLNFNGNFDGFTKDFVTYGRLSTDLGLAQTDLNFKLDADNNAFYSGNFALQDFTIGKYFGLEDQIGKVSLRGDGKGKGLKLNTLDLELDAVIQSMELKDYTYKNVKLNGRLKDKFFEGHLDINDENLALIFDGTIDATKQIPSFKFDAEVKNFNPNNLNLWNRNMVFSASLNADFQASNLDNLVGDVKVKDLKILTEEKLYALGDLALSSRWLLNNEKRFKLLSKDFDVNVEGKFELAKIPQAIQSVIIPNYKEKVDDQLLRFEVSVRNNPEILNLFVPELSLLKPSIIEGNLNSSTQSMLARIDLPLVQYKDFSIFNVSSNIFIDKGNFDLINAVPFVYYKDSILLQDLTFLVKGPRNNLDLKLYTDGAKNTSIELLANVITKNKRVKLVFEPSNIFINNQFWLIDANNEIMISEKVQSNNLKLYNGISELLVDLDIGTKEKKADVYLSNIFIEDFTQFLSAKNIALKGIANGRLGMEILEGTPGFFGNLMVENIQVNQYSVGNLNANASLDVLNKKVNLNANLYGDDNELDINGSYSFDKKSGPKDFDLSIDIKNFAVYTIEDFIAQYIDNAKGTVTGKLRLVGPRNAPDLLGFVDVNDVTTTVTYLQTTYNIKNQRVLFEKNAINLGNTLKVTDADGNEAFGKGKILHNHLKNISLDIEAWSSKIMGINTTFEDNKDFYGKAYLNGGVSFKGPVNDIFISVYGQSEAKSEIYIPLLEGSTNGTYEFYRFLEKEKTEEEKFLVPVVKPLKVKGLTVNLDLDLDNDCKLSIILDEAAGDVLEVKGEGNIKITVPKEGDVTFYGSYVINDGDYLFTLQSIINKRFRIEPNSYINFQGKIEDTKVNVDAVYNLRAAPKSLIADYLAIDLDEQLKDEAGNRVPVKLLLALRNNLYNPDITFDIQLGQINSKLRGYVDRKLLILKQYENEMNRQVFGLLVLNQFLPPLSNLDQITNGININASDAANTVSEFLSNQLTRYFNDWLSYFSDDVSFNFNYRNYDQDITSTGSTAQDLALRRELQLALTTQLLNDRVTINLGGNVDFGANQLGAQNSNTTYFGGNFSIEYALTENRRFRIKAFTNTNYDYFYSQNSTRAGVGLSFKREFDKMQELKISKEEFSIKNPKRDGLKVDSLKTDSLQLNQP